MGGSKRRSDWDEPVSAPSALPDDGPPPKPRRLFRRLVTFVVLLAVAALLAPEIVARTALLGQIVDWGTAGLQGRLVVGGATLSWFSPPGVSNVELVDDEGRPVLKAEAVWGDRTLWQLAAAPTQLGRFRLDRPEIHLVVRPDGTTNLEHVLEKLLAAPASSTASPPLDLAVQLVDGTLVVHDQASQRQWTIDRVNAVVIVPREAGSPLVADLQGSLVAPEGPRRLAAQCSLKNGSPTGAELLPQGDAAVTLEALPLDLVGTLARRFLPGFTLGGVAQGDLRARFDFAAAKPTGDVSGRFTVANLSVGGTALKGDQVQLAQFDVPLRLTLDGDRLQIDELSATCELASVGVRGSVDGPRRLFNVGSLSELVNLALECDGQATAKLDLARIAQAMPHVVRLRDDVQVTGGTVAMTAQSGGAPGARKQQVELATSGLVAMRGGQAIAWEQPLRAVATLVDTQAGPVVERIQCTSDFFTLDGTNTPQAFEVAAQYDLARLGERLAQFLDLGGLQLRGNGTARGEWQRAADGRFHVDGQAVVSDFALIAAGSPPWTEQQLVVGLDAVGRADGFTLVALESLTAGLQSAGDEVTVRLTEPVADARRADAAWPITVVGKGDLGTWLTRVRPFAGLPAELLAAGRADLNMTARVTSAGSIDVIQSRLTAQPLQLVAPGLAINEPSFDLQAVGRVAPTEAMITEATINAASLQSQVRQLVWRKTAAGTNEFGGDASLRADVGRVWAMLHPPTAAGAATTNLQIGGILEGNTQLQTGANGTNVALNGVVNNFFAVQQGGAAWQEPTVKLAGTATYDAAHDALAVERLEVAANALRMLLTGKIAALSTSRVLDCRGELEYDLAQLTPVAQSYLGSGVAFAGRDVQRFELTGPLADPARGGATTFEKLNGAAALGWQQANLYGFQLGRATLTARLNQGLVRVEPTDIPVNTGKVRLAPSLRLGPGPMELQADAGTVVDHVSITPEMANERLKYVVPILAGVAQVSGQFSVALDELRMPLDNPSAGTMAGRMTVHAVDIGPSTLLQELAPLVKQPLTASLKRESVVDFKLIQGRIYHQGLEFAFPECTVKTSGSVGLDQTVSMVAEVTLPANLLPNVPVASAALSNRGIRIPIGGSLQRFGIDGRALAEATKQTLQNAAEGALQQGLNRGLDRLFGQPGAAAQPATTVK
jgi:translocation and assembly module TamB